MCGGAYLSCSCSCLANPAWVCLWGSLLRALPSLDSVWWLLERWVEACLSRDSKLQPQGGKSMFLAEQAVSFVLHVPFLMPQINKYFIFLPMSLRSELSSARKPPAHNPLCSWCGLRVQQDRVSMPGVGDTAPLSGLPHQQQKHPILTTLLWHLP